MEYHSEPHIEQTTESIAVAGSSGQWAPARSPSWIGEDDV